MPTPQEHFRGKVVLVTGAGGSIGSEICRKLIDYGVDVLALVGHSEEPLYKIVKELTPICGATSLRTVLGSVTNEKLMAQAVAGVDIVIHAAAHKHIPLCEQNPVEAIQNNVGGTITLAEAASRANVRQFVMVSSDKAVKPSSIMGATKRACEIFINFLASRSATKFTTVRFGNVLNSSGSVLPLWREQIKKGGPLTLTDARCTRYFMSIPDAVELTLGAAALMRPDGLFVLDMGKPLNMLALAQQTLGEAGPGSMCVDIKFTGLRPGEKLEEELTYGGEQIVTEIPRVFRMREDSSTYIVRWSDFQDLLMAATCRAKSMALEKLWEIVA